MYCPRRHDINPIREVSKYTGFSRKAGDVIVSVETSAHRAGEKTTHVIFALLDSTILASLQETWEHHLQPLRPVNCWSSQTPALMDGVAEEKSSTAIVDLLCYSSHGREQSQAAQQNQLRQSLRTQQHRNQQRNQLRQSLQIAKPAAKSVTSKQEQTKPAETTPADTCAAA